jgi:hypothetical protein
MGPGFDRQARYFPRCTVDAVATDGDTPESSFAGQWFENLPSAMGISQRRVTYCALRDDAAGQFFCCRS